MNEVEANLLIEKSVVDLCRKCDPDCPVARTGSMVGKLPHCYQGDFGSGKLYDLMDRVGIQHPNLTPEDEEAIDQAFRALIG